MKSIELEMTKISQGSLYDGHIFPIKNIKQNRNNNTHLCIEETIFKIDFTI